MTSSAVPHITLHDGNTIPQLGFGSFKVDNTEAERIVSEALQAGYRHIDTAAFYGNEEGVGRAIAASAIPRDELFITTKLWNDRHGDPDRALAESLDRLGLDFVDLYLIHWPCPAQDRYLQAWDYLQQAQQDKLVRSIGVSNFLPEHLDRLLREADAAPVVDQIELHPAYQRLDDVEFLRDHQIAVEAWGPLGQGKYALLDAPEVTRAAEAHGKGPGQVIIRWHLQHGRILFPKSANPERIRQNIDVFDFELTDEEMAAIDGLDRGLDGRVGRDPNEMESGTI